MSVSLGLDLCWSFPRSGEVRRDPLAGTGDFGHVGRILLCDPTSCWVWSCGQCPGQECVILGKAGGITTSQAAGLVLGEAGGSPRPWLKGAVPCWVQVLMLLGQFLLRKSLQFLWVGPSRLLWGNHGIPGWFGTLKPLLLLPLPRAGTPSLSRGTPSPTQTIP